MENPTLAEARRIAAQPTGDRLDGKQGEEAKAVIIRILEDAGLDFTEGFRLIEVYGWERFTAGMRSASAAARETYETKD